MKRRFGNPNPLDQGSNVYRQLRKLLVAFVVFALFAGSPGHTASIQPADLVLHHAHIYTLDATRSWAEAVAIAGDRIVYVGPENGIGPWISPQTVVLDLGGKMLLPGFQDTHAHLIKGIELELCNLNDIPTQELIVEKIRRVVRENPGVAIIRGRGWTPEAFKNKNPDKSLLDRVVPDRPAFFKSASAHSAWVNSRTLQAANINRETKDPAHGHIERDPTTGEPTGILLEDAVNLVPDYIREYTVNEYVRGLRRSLEMARSFGITSLQEAKLDEKKLEAYAELDRRGELTARVFGAIYVDHTQGLNQLPRILELRKKFSGNRLRANTVKVELDGVIEKDNTAVLLEPYMGTASGFGLANYEPENLNRLVAELDRHNFQIHFHAIGDGAVRMALDALEHARAMTGARDSRHIIAHLELINPSDVPRFRRLGVIACFQPLWAQRDSDISEFTEPVLGPERSSRLYPLASVLKSGAVVSCGSDWPVTSINPLEAIQVAITRRALTGGPGPAWIPEELVDLRTILACYTINGAYANFQERETGSIEVGKAADLAVLDRNLFETPPQEIHLTRVLLTLLGGKEVYRDPSFNPGR
jgi:predicted amidohydrolase YtcJ